jgi:ribosomal protein S6E (S10)
MFIQVIQAKSTRRDEVRALMDEWSEMPSEGFGFLGGTYGFTDDDEFIGVVRFESKEKAMANSARPETDAMAKRMAELMDGQVEFQDCDDVTMWLEGGSDDAGFVQVIQGRTDEPDRIKVGMTEDPEEMRRQRPDVIGGTLAFTDDGRFTATVAFTDEASAREGEKNSEPPEEFTTLSRDVKFYDLRDPWFASA